MRAYKYKLKLICMNKIKLRKLQKKKGDCFDYLHYTRFIIYACQSVEQEALLL